MIHFLGRLLTAYALWRVWTTRNTPKIIFTDDTNLYRYGAQRLVYTCLCGAASEVRDPVTHICPECGQVAVTRTEPHTLRSRGRFSG